MNNTIELKKKIRTRNSMTARRRQVDHVMQILFRFSCVYWSSGVSIVWSLIRLTLCTVQHCVFGGLHHRIIAFRHILPKEEEKLTRICIY